MTARAAALLVALMVPVRPLHPQGPTRLTRDDAIATALASSPTIARAAADTLRARGGVDAARLLEDPSLLGSWSKSAPRWHVEVEWPLGLLGPRGAAIAAAMARRTVATVGWEATRATVALAADTAYTMAVAATLRAVQARDDAADGGEFLRIAMAQRAAGEASAFEVELARLEAGRLASAARRDSLAAIAARRDLALAMGRSPDEATWQLEGVLDVVDAPTQRADSTSLVVRWAEAELDAADREVALATRRRFAGINLLTGVEFGDPAGDERGILPVVGLTIPLPLYNRQRGATLIARADRDRAAAGLAAVRAEQAALVAGALDRRRAAREDLARDTDLLAAADTVLAMARTAYREGESSLANVLTARRTAREVRLAHVEHRADLLIASAVLHYLTLPSPVDAP